MAIVFISYRHEDSGGYAGRIADRLQERFGKDNVFRDIDSLRGGLSFEEALDQRLARATVLVAVIGKQWATITDDKGHRRLQAHDDWVRREVEKGLGRKIPVIPVLVGGAALPKRDDLPGSLQGLLKMQAVELRDGRSWATDLELLVRDIDSSRRWLRDKRLWVALLLLLLSAIGLYLRLPLSPPLTTNPLFDALVDEPQTCFNFDRVSGKTYAEVAFRLTRLVSDSGQLVRVFLGIVKVFDASGLPDDFDPASAPCVAPKCLAVKLWDDPRAPTVLRGGTNGTVLRLSATIPPGVARILVFGRFYQQEGAGGTECKSDPTRPYDHGGQLPYLARVDRSGAVVDQLCDGALDIREIVLQNVEGRYCLR